MPSFPIAPPYSPQLGDALLDSSIERALVTLWEGDLKPQYLVAIELGVRAFLTSKRLVGARQDGDAKSLFGGTRSYRPPFHGSVLAYEFIYPDRDLPLGDLQAAESAHLLSVIEDRLATGVKSLDAFEKPMTMLGAEARLTEIYSGLVSPVHWPSPEEYLASKAEWSKFSGEPIDTNAEPAFQTYTQGRALELAQGVARSLHRSVASYFVKCHRAGLVVFTNSEVGKICNEFLFTEWPRKLFENLDETYAKAVRSLRAPGVSVELPPMTAMLLNRAATRSAIPETLRDMRDEYERTRTELWSLIFQAWYASSYREQLKHLRQLQHAADSMHDAAFPESMDVLSLGLGIASLSVKDVAGKFREHDKPNSRVTSVSFAARLVKDLRVHLGNQGQVLKRHLSSSERIEFGLGP